MRFLTLHLCTRVEVPAIPPAQQLPTSTVELVTVTLTILAPGSARPTATPTVFVPETIALSKLRSLI